MHGEACEGGIRTWKGNEGDEKVNRNAIACNKVFMEHGGPGRVFCHGAQSDAGKGLIRGTDAGDLKGTAGGAEDSVSGRKILESNGKGRNGP